MSAVVAGLAGLASATPSDCLNAIPIFASDEEESGYFGTGIGFDGSWAVVGASTATVSQLEDAGKIYILQDDSGWAEYQIIDNPDPEEDASFGESAAISGDWVAAAAPWDLVDQSLLRAGKVHLFYRDTGPFGSGDWAFEQTLDAGASESSSPQAYAQFGGPVAGSHQGLSLSGSLLVIGEPYWDSGTYDNEGRVHVFGYNTSTGDWDPHAVLTSPDAGQGHAFGYAVHTDGTRIIIGETGNAKAYVYRLSSGSWSVQATFSDSGSFGNSVNISGNDAIVGNWSEAEAVVYRFIGSSWSERATLTTADTEAALFAYSVAIDGSTAVVGAPNSDHPGESGVCASSDSNHGAAYVYTRTGMETEEDLWDESLRLRSSCDYLDPSGDRFGETVYLDGDTVFVGSSNNEDTPNSGPTGAGAIFIYGGLPACSPE